MMTGIGGIWELMWKPGVGETSWNLQNYVPSEDSYLDMEDMVPNLVIFCNWARITMRKLGHQSSDKTFYLQFCSAWKMWEHKGSTELVRVSNQGLVQIETYATIDRSCSTVTKIFVFLFIFVMSHYDAPFWHDKF